MGFFSKIAKGLEKTRKGLSNMIDDLFTNYAQIDEELYEELEFILISSDVSVNAAHKLIEKLRESVVERKITNVDKAYEVFKEIISEELKKNETVDDGLHPLTVVVIIGVNGVGKTTTIGKLANYYSKKGKKVMVAAGDTFRAAAIEQLTVWAERANVPIIHQNAGSDPASVVFDAVSAATTRGMDYLICDTAGRLHNKVNLMNELDKIFRIIKSKSPEAKIESWLVLDATTGQNAISQAKAFNDVSTLTGLVLTKLDGTAKGGVVISISEDLGVPVKFVGLGEKIDDIEPFSADEFARGLFSK